MCGSSSCLQDMYSLSGTHITNLFPQPMFWLLPRQTHLLFSRCTNAKLLFYTLPTVTVYCVPQDCCFPQNSRRILLFSSRRCIYILQTLKRLAHFYFKFPDGQAGLRYYWKCPLNCIMRCFCKKVFASRLATYFMTGSSGYCFRNMEIALLHSTTSTF